ncbi:MAG: phospholipase D-like domain-containing protein [Deltaproteobacteria bacterium]|nr:phospholipase D-like domain-containing protein [Deltaproteobacteria bacterium]
MIREERALETLTAKDVLYTKEFYRRFLYSLSEPISKLVICSPYFDKMPEPFRDIVYFCEFQRKKGVDVIRVITRPPGHGNSVLSVEAAKRLAVNDVEVFVLTNPFLHAKLYHMEYRKGHFRSFVGSSNFTLGGFRRNHELVAEMEGVGVNSPCHREIERMLNSAGTIRYEAWLAREMPKGAEEAT